MGLLQDLALFMHVIAVKPAAEILEADPIHGQVISFEYILSTILTSFTLLTGLRQLVRGIMPKR
ncbi:hypothetical protein [Bacillus sp. V5-8f]|uniref:hypothetical protein n=1 Tax=Bacillus sp. V5-8f TaxID=2053044 RepID=UPI000C79031B|nr:hypothetical protein [Bacillus sp. V5-8f]PLT32044.1 hypothetical protein CUU64_20950 [Bacillus sp. V5-8f]